MDEELETYDYTMADVYNQVYCFSLKLFDGSATEKFLNAEYYARKESLESDVKKLAQRLEITKDEIRKEQLLSMIKEKERELTKMEKGELCGWNNQA